MDCDGSQYRDALICDPGCRHRRHQSGRAGRGVGDEVWYNPGDDHYYAVLSGGPLAPSFIVQAPGAAAQGPATLGVIHASRQTLDQLVPTFNVPAITTGPAAGQHPAGTAHSVAVDAANNHALVPLAANNVYPDCLKGCIAVYGRRDDNHEHDDE